MGQTQNVHKLWTNFVPITRAHGATVLIALCVAFKTAAIAAQKTTHKLDYVKLTVLMRLKLTFTNNVASVYYP